MLADGDVVVVRVVAIGHPRATRPEEQGRPVEFRDPRTPLRSETWRRAIVTRFRRSRPPLALVLEALFRIDWRDR